MSIGEARAIVLLGDQGACIPAILLVRAEIADAGCEFINPCPLSGKIRAHVSAFLAPLAKVLAANRGKSIGGFRLSFSLPESAHLHGERIEIGGRSADLAVVLAMVSVAVNEPLSDDVAATGQIADGKGRVGMVHGLEEKLTLRDSAVSTVLVPDWKNDALFARLYPQEFVDLRTAVKGASMRIVVVSDANAAFDRAKAKPRAVPSVPRATEEAKKSSVPRVEGTISVSDDDRRRARDLVTRCSESALVAAIDRPLEERFAAFLPEAREIESSPELLTSVERLLRHLGIAAGSELVRSVEAERLVHSAFAAEGGTPGALRMLRQGRAGGIRGVLIGVLEHLKVERRQNYVRGTMAEIVDPVDGENRLQLVNALLAEYQPLLPPALELAPAEELANDPARLVLAICAAVSQVTRGFTS
jgi:hypothetical protein